MFQKCPFPERNPNPIPFGSNKARFPNQTRLWRPKKTPLSAEKQKAAGIGRLYMLFVRTNRPRFLPLNLTPQNFQN